MVNVFALSAVDREFKPCSGQNKDDKIGICCFSALASSVKEKEPRLVLLGIGIMCPKGATCLLSVDCCFSKLAL
jgi:hypothetical protein